MTLELWFAFVAASAALLAVPGPVVLLLFSQTMANGRAVASAAIPGVVLGDLTAMSVSLAGAGAILAASSTLFTVLKLAGASYLVWLGIGLWRSGFDCTNANAPEAVSLEAQSGRGRAFRQAFVVTALNPKDVVFFVAFLPQFIDPASTAAPQLAIIVVTFLGMVVVSTSLWIAFGHRLRRALRNPTSRIVVTRTGASALIGAGAMTALAG